ncbi:hypothetical protein BBJ28_00010391 [Nothophytophthora sp. Chile5]|nr:hypothetical protein BBJ28_00010391 [Nothophytophthora sp. Chile5]
MDHSPYVVPVLCRSRLTSKKQTEPNDQTHARNCAITIPMSSVRCVMRSRSFLSAATRVAHTSTANTSHMGVRCLSSAALFKQNERLADESVMEHLVCPISKHPLRFDAERGSLICDEIRVEYPIWNGIPILVPSEGRVLGSNNDEGQV